MSGCDVQRTDKITDFGRTPELVVAYDPRFYDGNTTFMSTLKVRVIFTGAAVGTLCLILGVMSGANIVFEALYQATIEMQRLQRLLNSNF